MVVGRCKPVLSYLASPGHQRTSVDHGRRGGRRHRRRHPWPAEEHEDIRVHVVSREQAYRWVEEGAIDNAASVIALQWLALHHESLRKEWAN